MYWAGLSTRHSLKAPISIYCNLKYLNINTRRINYAIENKIAWTFKRKHRFSEGVCSLGWMDSHGSAHTWSEFVCIWAVRSSLLSCPPFRPQRRTCPGTPHNFSPKIQPSSLCLPLRSPKSASDSAGRQQVCPGQASLSFSLLCGHQESWGSYL